MKNEKERPEKENVKYTLDNLLNDIMDSTVGADEESSKGDRAGCEYEPNRIIVQMLIFLATKYGPDSYSDDDKLRNALSVIVEGDELLSGYMFHVSQNPQFEYSWSYLRKRQKTFIEFLASAVSFINNITEDINELIRRSPKSDDMHVVFGDVFDISLSKEEPYARAHIIWEDIHLIASVKKEYSISVKKLDSMLIAGQRKDASSVGVLFDAAMKMSINFVRDSE